MLKIMQIVLVLLLSKIILNASMQGSKHDLSVTNFYGPYPGSETEVCVFCHTPHAASTDISGPLWNRAVTDTSSYVLYSGITGVPNDSSLICLSCHDGVSGLNQISAVAPHDTHNVLNGPGQGASWATPNCYACHFSGEMYPGPGWTVGPDLTNDHPISVSYADAKAAKPGTFEETPLNDLRLDNGNVECISCHDPHKVDTSLFLRVSNQNSDLCKSCHIK